MRLIMTLFLIILSTGCANMQPQKYIHDNFADYEPSASIPPLKMPVREHLPAKDSYYEIPSIPESAHKVVVLYPPGSLLMEQAKARGQVSSE